MRKPSIYTYNYGRVAVKDGANYENDLKCCRSRGCVYIHASYTQYVHDYSWESKVYIIGRGVWKAYPYKKVPELHDCQLLRSIIITPPRNHMPYHTKSYVAPHLPPLSYVSHFIPYVCILYLNYSVVAQFRWY